MSEKINHHHHLICQIKRTMQHKDSALGIADYLQC